MDEVRAGGASCLRVSVWGTGLRALGWESVEVALGVRGSVAGVLVTWSLVRVVFH